ncbi:hypothetical protein KJY77_00010 [Canibacter sp. lx-72]|uniref:hypothetical protein n=1 Tax=Canibacter zhuwentaonis TaxID=2837491 RepID=UPI001BDBCABF|nr:hypothetical protein [Canibacter zhuwentaonis]MBT1017531.1 hypothetical protein [Canibacter zhuwentaonis]
MCTIIKPRWFASISPGAVTPIPGGGSVVVYQTGQTVAGVGVAAGQNTMLQVAGDKPVKPTTTTTSLQPGNTSANNTSKTKPATNPPHTTQPPAGINRTTIIADLVTTTTTTNKQQYHPGEKANIQVSFRYNDAAYQELQYIQPDVFNYTGDVNFRVQLPTGFTISQETLTKGPFIRGSGSQWSYNQQSHTLTGSFSVNHFRGESALQFFEELNITGTVTGIPNTPYTVTTTADGVLNFTEFDKTGTSFGGQLVLFTAIPSDATFRVVPRKTTLTASFTPVGLTEGQVVVRGDVVCTVPGGQPSRKTLMFTLKHNELANGRWDRVLHDMVDVGSNCVITIVKGAVPAGWRWNLSLPATSLFLA